MKRFTSKLVCVALAAVMLLLTVPVFALAAPDAKDSSKSTTASSKSGTTAATTEAPAIGASVGTSEEGATDASGEEITGVRKKITVFDDGVLIAADRGDWFYYPENSLEGIQYCASMGFDLIMLDVRKTSDGEFVLLTNNDISVTCVSVDGSDAKGKVDSITFDKLRAFCLREGKGGYTASTALIIPEISEAINACAGSITPVLRVARGDADDLYKKISELGKLEDVVFQLDSNAGDTVKWAAAHTDALVIGAYSGCFASGAIHKYIDAGINVVELSGSCTSGVFSDRAVNALGDKAMGMIKISESSADNCAQGWDKLISKGFTVIETDRPTLLQNYLTQTNNLYSSLQDLVLRYQPLYNSASSHFNEKEIIKAYEAAEDVVNNPYTALSELEKVKFELINVIENAQTGSRAGLSDYIIIFVIIVVVVLVAAAFFGRLVYKKKFSKSSKNNERN